MIRAGLVLLGLLSLVDVAGILLTDGDTPPLWVGVLGAVLGLASLVALWFAWRGHRRATITLLALRVVSALTAVPAFVEPDVPVGLVVFAAAFILLSLLGCGLVAPSLRHDAVRAG